MLRKAHIDILRILACLLVIFNHSNERGFYRFLTDELNTVQFGLDSLLSIICKSAVPVFFMISGSMLLNKEESIYETYKRIPKIAIDLVLFSFLYYYIGARGGANVFSVMDTIKTILQNSYWHLWYLYAYIALIVTLPFLRKFVKALDVKTANYMFIVAFIVMGILPIIEYFWNGINALLKPSWMTINIFIYPVLGYMIDRKLNVKSVYLKRLWCMNVLCFLVGIICEYNFLLREPGVKNEMFLTNFCLINASVIFITVKYFFEKQKWNPVLYHCISELGKCTYGIYLLHIIFLWKMPFFYNIWLKIEQGSVIGQKAGIFLSCVLCFLIAGAVTYILRRIPVVRKLF